MALVTQTVAAKRYLRPMVGGDHSGTPSDTGHGGLSPVAQAIYTEDALTVNPTGAADTARFELRFDLPGNHVWSLQKFNCYMTSSSANSFTISGLKAYYSPLPSTSAADTTQLYYGVGSRDQVDANGTYRRIFFITSSSMGDEATHTGDPINSPDIFLMGFEGTALMPTLVLDNVTNNEGPWSCYYLAIFNGYTLEDYYQASAHLSHTPAR